MKLIGEVQEAGYVLAILDFIKNNEESIDFDKLKLKFELHAIAWLLENDLLLTDICTFGNSKESRVWVGPRAKSLYKVSWEKRMEIIKSIDEAEE
jgi:hypothetical protein